MSKSTFPIFVLSILLLIPVAVFADGRYSESADGDLSGDGSMPTVIPISLGQNSVSAESVRNDVEYWVMTIPNGMQLDAITLAAYDASDEVAFIAVQRGSEFTEPTNNPNVANILGWSHFGPLNTPVGSDVLADMATGAGAIGFTPPLASGNYTFWVQQTGPVSTAYTLDFMVGPTRSNIAFAEGNGNELADTGDTPTAIAMGAGGNIVSGTSGNLDRDYFTFTVPEDHRLDAVLLTGYESQDEVAFGAIMQGSTFSEPPSTPSTNNFVAYGHFGAPNNAIGSDLLDDWTATGRNAHALEAGTYSVWLQQAGASTDYSLNFVIVPSAELAVGMNGASAATNTIPLALIILALASLLLLVRLRWPKLTMRQQIL